MDSLRENELWRRLEHLARLVNRLHDEYKTEMIARKKAQLATWIEVLDTVCDEFNAEIESGSTAEQV